MSKDPSVFQIAYTDELAKQVTNLVLKQFLDLYLERNTCAQTSGYPSHNQLPMLPQSMLHEWAGTCGENLRKLALNYFRENGVFPE